MLHAGNIKRGGEWLETRIFSSGPRTNPWFQESGPRIVSDGELLAEYPLEAAPAWDSIAIANQQLYIGLEDGTVQCLGQ